ncbi:MAG: DUF3800 domain-containing protein, partial [Muribaculaceae bacterium]
ILTKDKKDLIDPTISSLFVLIEHWYKKLGKKIDVVTDISDKFKSEMKTVEQYSIIKCDETLVGYDTRKHTYPLQVSNISMADSKTSFEIQIADIIASAVNFAFNNRNEKQIPFQNELKKFDVIKDCGYYIAEQSEEYLKQLVDSSEDIDPIEFLEDKLF